MKMKKRMLPAVAALSLLSGCAANSDKPDAWLCVLAGGGVGAAVGDSVAPGTGLIGGIIGGYLCGEAEVQEKPMPVAPQVKDSDGDTVADDMDHCPDTPAAAPVDAKGCAKDSDQDGVADYLDHCPGTLPEYKVDSTGCTQYMEQNISKELEIKFDSNQSQVKDVYQAEVKAIADFLNKYPQIELLIEGHTSKLGSAAYNQKLSQKRAEAVAALLVTRYGIAPQRVKTKGYGESRLLDNGDSKAAHERNRRILAVMHAQEKVAVKR